MTPRILTAPVRALVIAFALATLTALPAAAQTEPDYTAPVSLAGANGRVVEFAGIWEARPDGLVVVTSAESAPTLVAWDKFDLAKLKLEQPSLNAARQRAVFLRTAQPVNLGLFAEILTSAQVGSEIRRVLDEPSTVKVPVAFRTTTETNVQSSVVAIHPTVLDGLVLHPPVTIVNQRSRTETETRQITPDEIVTTPRRVLQQLARTTDILYSDQRALFELNKINPKLLEDAAQGLERVRASLPPKHFLANDPTLQTLDHRLTEAIVTIRDLSLGQTVHRSQQNRIAAFLTLADHPILR